MPSSEEVHFFECAIRTIAPSHFRSCRFDILTHPVHRHASPSHLLGLYLRKSESHFRTLTFSHFLGSHPNHASPPTWTHRAPAQSHLQASHPAPFLTRTDCFRDWAHRTIAPPHLTIPTRPRRSVAQSHLRIPPICRDECGWVPYAIALSHLRAVRSHSATVRYRRRTFESHFRTIAIDVPVRWRTQNYPSIKLLIN